ncbi:DUF2859 domain-containing protein [Vibrio parahaemolyticus]|nr:MULTISPECIES: DUF2859 domain-containing protein [Vibrio harveyi group]EGQ8101361.1 DUF2859 domain-containing protein [Vibrio parahaemolyticus]EGQ8229625.1 DUF2859 domain-containing protein [Vibrio parahaemolyticus]EGQ8329909.1 DUF2859 domain-containing protein [Vibrio parahaemolyticus]EGQ8550798.1 DUF2859 domain-containing protein [Vibrio parahaemolyticus]EGQ8789104.1 DUF2859 domain-containing protein [Vibrio parahaemolyticus]
MENISVLSCEKITKKATFALRTAILFVCLGGSSVKSSELIVLADRGGEPTQKIMADILDLDAHELQQVRSQELERLRSGAYQQDAIISSMMPDFPVQTTRKEEKFKSQDFIETRFEIHRPLVLLGDGPMSLRWLQKNSRRLKEIRAFVLMVNAESQESVFKFSRIYGDNISVLPKGDVILDKYQVPSLPALITQDGVYQ